MTTLREAAQQALEALKMMRGRYEEYACPACDHADAAIYALKEALVEDAMQKFTDVNQELMAALGCDHCNSPLYAAVKCRVCGRVTEQAEPVHLTGLSIRAQSTIGRWLNEDMDRAVANGANSISMPDELVEIAAWLHAQAEPVPTHRINSWGFCGVCRHDRIPGEGCARQECPDSPQQAEPVEPYCHVYEYDGVFGLHREFYPLSYNGIKPSRTVPVYTAPQQRNPVGWDGRCMLGHCNSPAGCENSGECRAAERAHGIGGQP